MSYLCIYRWGRTCLLAVLSMALPVRAAVNITQHHNHLSRDGLYTDPAFTQTAAAGLTRDLSFNGIVAGNVYAQPLYIEGGPGGVPMVIVVTESNNVYALDATSGTVLWQCNVGPAVPLTNLPCGNIDPLGITGTPVVDLASRSLVFDAMVTPDGGTTKRHLLYSLNVDTGTTNAGWPVDVNSTALSGTNVFNSSIQNNRGALLTLGGTVYVPYGGFYGDCGAYHGWVVGVPLNAPADVSAWCTSAERGGIWAVGGIASDGADLFVATGNTSATTNWGGGEALIRFQPGPIFSGSPVDYWAPANWLFMDTSDQDLGSSGPLLVDLPGAVPSQLAVALDKSGYAYLLNRTNLGGVSVPLAQARVAYSLITQAAVTYRTARGTYVAFWHDMSISAFRITATSPPAISNIWSASLNGYGSPFVTSSDGTNATVVWAVGAMGDQRLHGFDGDTGNVVYAGGCTNELMSGTRKMDTGIAAHGRIYIANDNRVWAFTVPVYPITLTATLTPTGAFSLSFTNAPGMLFTVFGSSRLFPSTDWTALGSPTEISPGQYQFTDPVPPTSQTRLYRVGSF